MGSVSWIGTNGDWNDPDNWAGGLIPSPQDVVEFTQETAVTVSGSAYIGSMDLNGASLVLAGSFSTDGVDPAGIYDGVSPSGVYGSLTISPWASVAVDTLDLSNTELSIQGFFQSNSGTVATVALSGTSANWLCGDTDVTADLSVLDGAIVAGDLSLSANATVVCDSQSTIQGGTITAGSNTSLNFVNVDGGSEAGSFALGEAIVLAGGGTLTLNSPDESTIVLDALIGGKGTMAISGATVNLEAQFDLTADLSLKNVNATAGEILLGDGTITLASSSLDMHLGEAGGTTPLTVDCVSGKNTVLGGASPVVVAAAGSSSLDFTGGAGPATISGGGALLSLRGGSGPEEVFCGSSSGTIQCGSGNETVVGGSGTLYVQGGSGDDQVWGGSGDNDTIIGGAGADTLFGGTGASVYAEGSGAALLCTYQTAGSALLDASKSSGNDYLFDNSTFGVTTMRGGSGDDVIVGGTNTDYITCGSGRTDVFSGSGVGDTIIGNSGPEILIGGPGASISAGSGAAAIVSFGQGTYVDLSAAIGGDTVFATGSGITSVVGGAGTEYVVGSTSPMSVTGGSGMLAVWGSTGGHDTITGSSGNDTLVASTYSYVTAVGNGNNSLVSTGTGVTLDASRATGHNELFLSATGSTNVILGNGQNTVVGSGQAASIQVDGGSGEIWAGMGALQITMQPSDVSGVLDIYQFNPDTSSISLSNSNYEESVVGGSTHIICGNQTVVLEGVVNIGQSVITVGGSAS